MQLMLNKQFKNIITFLTWKYKTLKILKIYDYSATDLPNQRFSTHQGLCWIHHSLLCPSPESSSDSVN